MLYNLRMKIQNLFLSFFFWSQLVSHTQATCKWCPLPVLSSVKLQFVSAEVFKTFPMQYGRVNKKADCNGISYGGEFVYSFPWNCTLIICVLVRTFFVITCNICYLSQHHIFVFYYLCMFPHVILCHLRAEFLPYTFSRTTQLMWTVHDSFRWFA